MFEFMALAALVAGILVVAAAVAVIGFALKVLFKLLLLPFWLLGVILKVAVFVGLALLALTIAPMLVLGLLVILPLAAVAGMIGFGVWVVA